MTSSTIQFFAKTLGLRVSMNVLLPDVGTPPFPTLYLLHGLSDDHTIWSRLTRIEMYAWKLPMAIVMPQGFRGFYTNNERGPAYADYVVNDVIGTAERFLPLKRTRNARSIAGLSMGGYGALRLSLGFPDLFCAAVSHSGALIVGRPVRPNSPLSPLEYDHIFGPDSAGTDHDLLALAVRAQRKGKLPRLLFDCGVDDVLIERNREFHASLDRKKVPHTYREFPGSHNWDYWDEHVREALSFVGKAMRVAPVV